MDDVLNFDAKLNHIKIKNKCVYILKYYLIHSYDSEIIFLLQTLKILKMKYPQYANFIEKNIENIFINLDDRLDGISSKIQDIINSINLNNFYNLYGDIISTLEC
jgi:hypothetical protein